MNAARRKEILDEIASIEAKYMKKVVHKKIRNLENKETRAPEVARAEKVFEQAKEIVRATPEDKPAPVAEITKKIKELPLIEDIDFDLTEGFDPHAKHKRGTWVDPLTHRNRMEKAAARRAWEKTPEGKAWVSHRKVYKAKLQALFEEGQKVAKEEKKEVAMAYA